MTPPATARTAVSSTLDTAVRRTVRELLEASPGYREASPELRRSVARSMVDVSLLAARLLERERGLTAAIRAQRRSGGPAGEALAAGDQTSFKAARAGADVIRGQADAINFPAFVTNLISGVFRAITRSNLEQVTALADLLDNVAASSETFTATNISGDEAARWAAGQFPFLVRDPGGALKVADGADLSTQKKALQQKLGASAAEIGAVDDGNLTETLLPLVQRKIGRDRQAILGTIVQLGLQRIVVDQGRLHASMDLRVDTRSASEQDTAQKTDARVGTAASASVAAGPWGASASVSASFAHVKSDRQYTKEEMATRAGLRSSVDLAFRTEQVPLDRLADANARVKIDANARVPAGAEAGSLTKDGSAMPAAPELKSIEAHPVPSAPPPPGGGQGDGDSSGAPRRQDASAPPQDAGTAQALYGAADATSASPPLRSSRRASLRFDIWHEVPLAPQRTGMSCWAAAAAMLVSWRDARPIAPEQIARRSGREAEYRDGLEPRDVASLARSWGLVAESARRYTVASLRALLEAKGPLWVGEASPGLHVIVIAGMYGDGSATGTWLRVLDPWPDGRGERYVISFQEFAEALQRAQQLTGAVAQVLHTGGRGAGSRRLLEATRRTCSWRAGGPRYGVPYKLFEVFRNMPPHDPMTVPFPERRPDAPGGAAFLASLADMKLSARQEAMAAALLAGNVPARLRRFVEVTVARRGHTAVLRVAPDFLLIGSDDDFVTAPLRALVAQRVADALGCVLPTRPLVDAVLAAGAKAPLKGMWREGAPDGWLESWRCHRDHQARLKRPTAPPGALVAGYLKDVVLTPSLQKKVARNRRWPVAIYGAWDASKAKVVQGLVHDHAIDYVDYSHGTRLVSAVMTLDGVERAVADVLADPALAGALCDDGVIVPARYEPERA